MITIRVRLTKTKAVVYLNGYERNNQKIFLVGKEQILHLPLAWV